MEKITNYVENLFYNFPRTEEVARLKMQIIDSMNEKCQALLNDGKNENEAFGIVVSEFGSIEELKKEFDIPTMDSKTNKETIKKESEPKIKIEELTPELKKHREAYFEYQKMHAFQTGLGVAFCILASMLSALFATKYHELFTIIGFFIPIAIGVFIFVMSGIKNTALKQKAKINSNINIDENSNEVKQYREKYFAYQKIYAPQIGVGVVMCVLGVTLGGIFGAKDNELFVIMGFFIPIVIGVFLFVTAGIKNEALKKAALIKTDAKSTQKSDLSKSISGIIMLIALAVFLVLGIGFELWHPGWLVFPVGGLLCGITEIIVGLTGKKK